MVGHIAGNGHIVPMVVRVERTGRRRRVDDADRRLALMPRVCIGAAKNGAITRALWRLTENDGTIATARSCSFDTPISE